MGFDFYMEEEPRRPPEGYVPLHDGHPEYYQLNWVGMGLLWELLEAANVLDHGTPKPDLGALWPPRGMHEERAEEVLAHIRGESRLGIFRRPSRREIALVNHASAEIDRQIEAPSPKGRVCSYKFGSNEGWLVTPEECGAMVDALEISRREKPSTFMGGPEAQKMGPEAVETTLNEWIWYSKVASEHGGFRVL